MKKLNNDTGKCHGHNQLGYGHYVLMDNNGVPYMIMEGQFKDKELNGFGRCIVKDGCCYTGSYKNGIRSGVGKYHWANGNYYDGEWSNHTM